MKKILISLIIVCLLIMHIPVVKAENKVKVYMFTKSGCPACETAYDYFNGLLSKEPELFELVTLQVWNGEDKNGQWILASQDLLDLMRSSLDYFGEDNNRLATPTIAIGDYLQIGASNLNDFYDRIIKYRDSENPVDVIKNLADKQNIDIDKLKEVTENEETPSKNYDEYILIGIFVFLIGGFAALVTFGKKK